MSATSTVPPGARAPGDGLFAAGMAAVALAAAVSSYSGLASLADLAGWNHRLALLLPVTIDAYAMTATRAWLSPSTPTHARGWAKGNAIGAILTSVAGNGVAHAAHAGEFHVGWPIVVAVSAIPSIVLGLITHLWHLRNTPDPQAPPATVVRPEPTGTPAAAATGSPTLAVAGAPTGSPLPPAPRPRAVNGGRATGRRTAGSSKTTRAPGRSDAEVLDAGRLLAAQLGTAPTATRLRKETGIGTDRARRLAAILAAESVPTDATEPSSTQEQGAQA
jgi:hypothetical protein